MDIINVSKIQILDCTLRDGGYVNNWSFGFNNIQNIIKNLLDAKIDYIECGYLKNIYFDKDKSFFSKINDLQTISNLESNFALMINYGEYPITKFYDFDKKVILRIAFKKEEAKNALDYCEKLKKIGFDIFINPMFTNSYTLNEMIEMVKIVNQISPQAFSIVDSTGGMKEKEVLLFAENVNKNLSKNIALCFHSHNNLQLSLANAQSLIRTCKDRDLIIDSTLLGIGRGAGNIQTEHLASYLNENLGSEYNIVPILKTVKENIYPIYKIAPWGYSIPHYFAAIHNCHPNYAKYLVQNNICNENVDTILSLIPEKNKLTYNENLIAEIVNQIC